MIVSVTQGNILDSDAQTWTNTVNTVGVMGKGIALEFKRRFPEMYKDYVARCEAGQVKLGEPYLWTQLDGPWVLNFPTKDHWRSVSKLEDIVAGLEYLADRVDEWGIESLAVPPLGCGQGQLDWAVVGPTLFRHLDELPIPVELFAPWDVPEGQLDLEYLASAPVIESEDRVAVDPGWVALAHIAALVNEQAHAWPVGKTRFQKLAYLATIAGIDAGLEFTERSYGPFADGMNQVLSRLVNNGLVAMRPEGRMVRVEAGPTLDHARERFASYLAAHHEAIDRTVDLMSRLDGPQTEAAATVLFVARALRSARREVPTESDVLKEAVRWKARRRPPISEDEFAEAIRVMRNLGWLEAHESDDLPVDEDVMALA